MPTHAVFLTHRTLPGRRGEVRDVWQQHMAPAIAANPDHVSYYYCFDPDDEDVIRVFQLYRSAAAASEFLRHPNYLAYLAAVEPLLDGPSEVRRATPQWTKPEH